MPFSPFAHELVFQYNNLFHVLVATIRPLSRKQWINRPRPSQVPARQACHILWSCELFATGNRDGCQTRFGCSVHALDGEISEALIPTSMQVIEYAGEV
jgi:hypothetical protein